MKFKHALIALAAMLLIVAGGAVVYAAADDPTASCTPAPAVSPAAGGVEVTVTCTVPTPAPVTETVTETATATATVTAVPSPSQSPTSSPTPTVTPTPTSTPTPTTPPPSSGWPDASNTGPTGTLTSYTGPMTITTAGTVIDSKVITGDLVIRAANVTVSNSEIRGTIATDENSSGYSFTISDSLVNAGQRMNTGVGAVNFTMLRTEVTGGNRSVNCWKNCVVRDSYVHGQFRDSSGRAHESGIRMGSVNQIIHNTILCDAPDVPPDAGCSADLTGYGDFAAVQDVLVQGNLMKATTGGTCAYGGSSGGKPYSNGARDIRFIDNVFERGPGGKCGYWFAITDFNPSRPGNVWSGNRWDNGAVLNP